MATGVWTGDIDMSAWCTTNCFHNPPHCPTERCSCEMSHPSQAVGLVAVVEAGTCVAVGAWAGDTAMSHWCYDNCILPGLQDCAADRCACVTGEPSTPPAGPCTALADWTGNAAMTVWCDVNCNAPTPFCPPDLCTCTTNNLSASSPSISSSIISTLAPPSSLNLNTQASILHNLIIILKKFLKLVLTIYQNLLYMQQ